MIHESDTITIPLRSYTDMQRDIARLRALEEAGVDNWEGYSDAVAELGAEDR